MPNSYSESYRGLTLADIMQRRGQQTAQMHLARGNASANMWLNAGNAINNAVAGWQQNVERNRQLEIESAREARRANAEGLQIALAEGQLRDAEGARTGRRVTGDALAQYAKFTADADGFETFDRQPFVDQLKSAGLDDHVPGLLEKLDAADRQAKADRLAMVKMQQDAIARQMRPLLENQQVAPDAVRLKVEHLHRNGLMPDDYREGVLQALDNAPDKARDIAEAMLRDSQAVSQEYDAAQKPVALGDNSRLVTPDGRVIVPEVPDQPKAAAVGSFEDYLRQRFGERPTSEQIELGRKDYQQADDRPAININTPRPLTQNAESQLIGQYQSQWQKTQAEVKELDRQLAIMEAGLGAADRGDLAQANEVILQTFLKVIDPNSVVREGEFWRLKEGQSLIDRAKAGYQRIHAGGWVTGDQLQKYAQLAREIRERVSQNSAPTRARIQRNLDRYNIPHELVFSDGPSADVSSASGSVRMRIPDGTERLIPAGQVEEAKRRGATVVP